MSPLRVEVLPNERNGFLFLDGQGIFRLLEPFEYEDKVLGKIVVPAGFETDFCSIPAIARAFFPVSGKAAPAGTLHDWLLREDSTKKHASAVFGRALKDAGVFCVRRWLMVAFVAVFTFPDVHL